jgi:hypothetical protein
MRPVLKAFFRDTMGIDDWIDALLIIVVEVCIITSVILMSDLLGKLR